MLDIQTIENALLFLGRAQLTGNEVPAFVQVSNALTDHRLQLIAQSAAATAPSPAEQPLQDSPTTE
jgi:hypothetical protein